MTRVLIANVYKLDIDVSVAILVPMIRCCERVHKLVTVEVERLRQPTKVSTLRCMAEKVAPLSTVTSQYGVRSGR